MRKEEATLGPLTFEEYLAFEETAELKHEFVAGRLYAMTGTTARHNRIVRNVLRAFERLLSNGAACEPYFDLKVRAAADRVYYPDVVVVCGPHGGDTLVFDAPCLVVEVTSPSTRRTDRGEKLDAYLRMPSLRAYLIIEHDRRHATLYSRVENTWLRDEIVASGAMRLPCVDATLTLEEVYADVALPARVREDDETLMDAGN